MDYLGTYVGILKKIERIITDPHCKVLPSTLHYNSIAFEITVLDCLLNSSIKLTRRKKRVIQTVLHVDGLVQEIRKTSASAMKLRFIALTHRCYNIITFHWCPPIVNPPLDMLFKSITLLLTLKHWRWYRIYLNNSCIQRRSISAEVNFRRICCTINSPKCNSLTRLFVFHQRNMCDNCVCRQCII